MKPHAWLIDFSRVGFLLWMLAPISLASAQEVRNPCNPVAPMRVAPMPVYVPEVAPREVYEPQIAEAQIAEIKIAQPEIFKPDLCPNPSPIGIRYIPAITAKIRSEYETSLYTAKGIDARTAVSGVSLDAHYDVWPTQIFYYVREGFAQVSLDTLDQCMWAGQQDGNLGVCLSAEGPIKVFFSGTLLNKNPFPLRSVTIRCDYLDSNSLPRSFQYVNSDVLGPGGSTNSEFLGSGGAIHYVDKIIGSIPPPLGVEYFLQAGNG